VIDGPWEGKQYHSELPYFQMAVSERLSPFNHYDKVQPTMCAQTFFYRWSAPLRGWVFMWGHYPDRYAYECERYYY
jgi:hypothetical protein